jgi:hypothetical protein
MAESLGAVRRRQESGSDWEAAGAAGQYGRPQGSAEIWCPGLGSGAWKSGIERRSGTERGLSEENRKDGLGKMLRNVDLKQLDEMGVRREAPELDVRAQEVAPGSTERTGWESGTCEWLRRTIRSLKSKVVRSWTEKERQFAEMVAKRAERNGTA